MKTTKIYYLLLIIGLISVAQNKDCVYDFEEKTDSTNLKIIAPRIIHEKIFGNTTEIIQFELINQNNIPIVKLQQIQKSTEFIPLSCINSKSKIYLQLQNGSIVTLISVTEDACGVYNYLAETKSNIRVVDSYFAFTATKYEDLKESPISLMRIQFADGAKDYVIKDKHTSELQKEEVEPSKIFIDYLHCIE